MPEQGLEPPTRGFGVRWALGNPWSGAGPLTGGKQLVRLPPRAQGPRRRDRRLWCDTQTGGIVTKAQLQALEFLGEHGQASVSGAGTGVHDGELSIHHATVEVLVRQGFVGPGTEGVELTDKGKRRIGLIKETRAERQQRHTAEALAAQESGEWQPAPAGAGPAAERELADARREWAQLVADVHQYRDMARFERELRDLTREWDPDADLTEYQRRAEEYAAAADKAQARLDELRRQREAAGG